MTKFSSQVIEDNESQFTVTVGTTMVQEGYGIIMNATEDLTYGYSMTEAVTKYVERATQHELRIRDNCQNT